MNVDQRMRIVLSDQYAFLYTVIKILHCDNYILNNTNQTSMKKSLNNNTKFESII